VIKYLGIIGDTKHGAAILTALLEPKATRTVVMHAIFKTGHAIIPTLIQVGLRGGNHTRLHSAWILRRMTGQLYTSQKHAEWARWWMMNRKRIETRHAQREKAEAAADWPVTDADWAEYDRPIYIGETYTAPMSPRGRGSFRRGG
jgi:hypothetical protein